MAKLKRPNFRLQKIYGDGTSSPPSFYEWKDLSGGWTMGRRGFLLTSGLGLGLFTGRNFLSALTGNPMGPQAGAADDPRSCAAEIKAHKGPVASLSFSPDSKILASAGDTTIKLWEMPSRRLLHTLDEHTDDVVGTVFGPDGSHLASCSKDRTIRIWDVAARTCLKVLKDQDYPLKMDFYFTRNGRLLGYESRERPAESWDVPYIGFLKENEAFRSFGGAYALSPDKTLLAAVPFPFDFKKNDSQDVLEYLNKPLPIMLFETASGKLRHTLEGQKGINFSMDFSPDGHLLVSGSPSGTIMLWDTVTGKAVMTIKSPEKPVDNINDFLTALLNGSLELITGVWYSPDGKWLLSAGLKTLEFWQMPSGTLLRKLKGDAPFEIIIALAFSPDGKILATGGADNAIKLYGLPEMDILACLFDPVALEKGKEINHYQSTDTLGQTMTYTLPCGSPIPAGAVCLCNCVPGTYVSPTPTPKPTPLPSPTPRPSAPSGGGSYCTCNLVCTCDKICTCVPIK